MDTRPLAVLLDGYEKISDHVAKMIREDSSLIDESDRWLPAPHASDFNRLYVDGNFIHGEASVWTMQTGGSTEYVGFSIEIDKFIESFKQAGLD